MVLPLLFRDKYGFSLVELSIVLVILGLLVGGILSGKSLIRAATVRAQLAQVHQVVTSARTFREKYLNYPGDLVATLTTLPGGASRVCWDGQGGGNGDGLISLGPGAGGEASLFWNDLTTVGMFPGKYAYIFPSGGCAPGSNLGLQTGSAIDTYLPAAKLGNGLYLYIWSNGVTPQIWAGSGSDGFNYITIAAPQVCGVNSCGTFKSTATVKVMDAYSMDAKMDDGYPQTGSVLASYFNDFGAWAGTPGGFGSNHLPNTIATAGSPTTCYDNDNAAGTRHHYSVAQDNGEGANCAISFRF